MATISELVVKITGDASGLSKATQSAKKELGVLGSAFDGLKDIIGPAALGAALISATKAMADYIGEVSVAADVIDKTSLRTGIATDELQAYKYAAEQSGVSFESFTSTISTMTRGLETNAEMFSVLGVATKNTDGSFRSTQSIFNETISVLADMENETQRNKLALQLFGRGAAELTPLLAAGSKGIKELKDRASELGLVMSSDLVGAGVEFGDITQDLDASVKALGYTMAEDLLPVVNNIVTGLVDFIKGMVNGKQAAKDFQEYLKSGGTEATNYERALKGANDELARLEIIQQQIDRAPEFATMTREELDKQVEAVKQAKRELLEVNKGQQLNARYAGDAAEAQKKQAEAAAKTLVQLEKQEEINKKYKEARNEVLDILDSELSEYDKIRLKIAELESMPWASGKLEEDRKKAVEILYSRIEELQDEQRERQEKEIADSEAATEKERQERIAALNSYYEEYESTFYGTQQITEDTTNAFAEQWGNALDEVGAGLADVLQSSYLDGMREIGEAFKDSGDGLEAMAAGIKEVWDAIVDALPELLLQAGLQILPVNAVLGASLIAASGLVAVADAAGAFDNPLVAGLFGGIGAGIAAGWEGISDFFGFAGGTDFAPGGQAVVGENGPEIVNLPRGSEVIPNHELNRASGASVNIVINSPREVSLYEAKRIFDMTARNLAFEGVL